MHNAGCNSSIWLEFQANNLPSYIYYGELYLYTTRTQITCPQRLPTLLTALADLHSNILIQTSSVSFQDCQMTIEVHKRKDICIMDHRVSFSKGNLVKAC